MSAGVIYVVVTIHQQSQHELKKSKEKKKS